MLVGGSPSGCDSGAEVRWLCVSRSVVGGRSPQGAGDSAGGIRPICPETAANLPHMWTGNSDVSDVMFSLSQLW
ncbi:hypothetical protein HF086_004543 [Spodoptera exigua]|uniref:Uncharacterized protein n=1 Tax=Spodoptera exigua TaxID=7107 RepID=A0A922M9L0_SPOEX|nr:hypothetical protein HF086_004543 [Spodoptera exigua]